MRALVAIGRSGTIRARALISIVPLDSIMVPSSDQNIEEVHEHLNQRVSNADRKIQGPQKDPENRANPTKPIENQ